MKVRLALPLVALLSACTLAPLPPPSPPKEVLLSPRYSLVLLDAEILAQGPVGGVEGWEKEASRVKETPSFIPLSNSHPEGPSQGCAEENAPPLNSGETGFRIRAAFL